MKRIAFLSVSFVLFFGTSFSLIAQNDRAIFELKGPVSQVEPQVQDMGDAWMTYLLAFSPSGQLLKVNLFDISNPKNGSYYLTRDRAGRIVELSAIEGEGLRIIRYRYDSAGRVTGQDWCYENIDSDEVSDMGKTSISYDDDGNKVQVVISFSDESPSETITYTDYQLDGKGNWISRRATRPGQYEKQLETRKIVYF